MFPNGFFEAIVSSSKQAGYLIVIAGIALVALGLWGVTLLVQPSA